MTDITGRAPAVRPRARRVLATAVTVLAVSASVLSSFWVFGAESFVPGQVDLEPGWRAGIGLLVAIGAAIALCWRHHNPVLVTGIAVVPPLVFVADALAALIALAALAASRRDHVLWLGTAAVYAATAVALAHDAGRDPEVSPLQWLFGASTTADRTQGHFEVVDVPVPAVLVIAVMMTAIPLGIGLLRGTRRELSHSERKEEELLAEVTRRDERSRIAREMHDVLGHRLSLLSLQAGALEVNSHNGPERLAEVARTVRGSAREALDDLRKVIGVLREGGGLASGNPPGHRAEPAQPNLVDLPDLISNSRRAGLNLNVTMLLDDAASAPEPLGVASYRIVQESLTNVLRHAAGTTAEVTVRGGPGVGITIDVRNPLPHADGTMADADSGCGLTGIAERVSALDGNVSVGPTDDDTFVVSAWLPWPKQS
ncbi:Histidine kinase [Amycolatopsis marina]|uniref:histidine kinase n=1 Tax=Amycolatopsis marina TaxID=490629 RepID=A0A1I0VZC2_9PSEU|nr:histidine kinase [Amycolatopsis marina]SFA81701.1 Histidine kinase [Amycolatopsis marina]